MNKARVIRTSASGFDVRGWWESVDYATVLRPEDTAEFIVVFQEVHSPMPMHVHPNFDEVYIIHSGLGSVVLDGESHEVGPCDVVWIPRGTRHAALPASSSFQMWAVGRAPAEGEEIMALRVGEGET